MNSILSNYSITFLHIPKTGGVWVCSAMNEAGIKFKAVGHEHGTHDRMIVERLTKGGLLPLRPILKIGRWRNKNQSPPKEKSFCFVRHPLRLYESIWKYQMDRCWRPTGKEACPHYWHPFSALNELGSSDFNEFVWNVMRKRPGFVNEIYYSVAKSSVTWIGKTERLVDDLIFILNSFKVKFSEDKIRNKPKINESSKPKDPIVWDPDLRKLITKLELPSLMQFGYLTPEEADQLGVPYPGFRHPGLINPSR